MNTDFDKYLRHYQEKYDIGKTYFKNRNTSVKIMNPIPVVYSKPKNNVQDDRTKNKFNENLIDTPLEEFRKYYNANIVNKPKNIIPKSKRKTDFNALKSVDETLISTEIDQPKTIERSPIKKSADINRKSTEEKIFKNNDEIDYDANSEKSKDVNNQNESYLLCSKSQDSLPDANININSQTSPTHEIIKDANVNIKNIEENIEKLNANTFQDSSPINDVQVVIEGFIENKHTDNNESAIEMTVIISPRSLARTPRKMSLIEDHQSVIMELEAEEINNKGKENNTNSEEKYIVESKEKESRVDEDIKEIDEIMKVDDDPIEKESTISSARTDLEFPDNLSVDIDNYVSRSDYSPISLPKTAEDDNFWDG